MRAFRHIWQEARYWVRSSEAWMDGELIATVICLLILGYCAWASGHLTPPPK